MSKTYKVGKPGSFMINHMKKSDLHDGPDCFVDRTMNANICRTKDHNSLSVKMFGTKANWNTPRNHWLIQRHDILHNDPEDWTTFVTKEVGDSKDKNNNLITFAVSQFLN